MIKQNIKVALLAILGFISFWMILFCFIKLDISTSALITFDQGLSYMTIDNKSAAYIENHGFEYIKLEYEKQYFNCHITFVRSSEIQYVYFIVLPDVITISDNYFITNIVIDSLNIYQYLLKK